MSYTTSQYFLTSLVCLCLSALSTSVPTEDNNPHNFLFFFQKTLLIH